MFRFVLPLVLAGLISIPGFAQDDAAEPSAILVLDNCDDEYSGKEEYKDNLTLVTSTGEQVFRISGFNGCEGIGSSHEIAVDYNRERIWVIENARPQIRQLDFSGNETLTIPETQCSAIAVDPEAGYLWALTNSGLIYSDEVTVFNSDGEYMFSYGVRGHDIAYDPFAKAFWIAGRDLTKIDAATGEIAFGKQIAPWCALSLDVDSNSGAAWVGVGEHPDVVRSSNRLIRFDGNGDEALQIELGQRRPFKVSVDPRDGSVWVANFGQSIEHYSVEGEVIEEHAIEALAVEVDHLGKVWAVTPEELLRIDAEGEPILMREHAGHTSQAWLISLEQRHDPALEVCAVQSTGGR